MGTFWVWFRPLVLTSFNNEPGSGGVSLRSCNPGHPNSRQCSLYTGRMAILEFLLTSAVQIILSIPETLRWSIAKAKTTLHIHCIGSAPLTQVPHDLQPSDLCMVVNAECNHPSIQPKRCQEPWFLYVPSAPGHLQWYCDCLRGLLAQMHYPCQWRNETELEAYSCLRHPWSLELTHASSSNKLVSCSALMKERHSTCKEQYVEFPHTNDPVGTLEYCNQGTHTCVSSACLITPHLLLLTNRNIHAITRIQFVKLPHLPTGSTSTVTVYKLTSAGMHS